MYYIPVGTLLKDVGYYGLRFLSICDEFPKNWMDGRWVGGGVLSKFFGEFFNFARSLNDLGSVIYFPIKGLYV